MPYIRKDDRVYYDVTLGDHSPATGPGELNFQITQLCLQYMSQEEINYQRYNDIIGVLESCKLEFYRRAVAPYEAKKIEENGDVYNV